jgi:hypothetical protein
MWMVDTRILCRKHLLGEHVETHMFVGAFNKGTKAGRFASENLLEFKSLRSRHDELAREMERRGYSHTSPLPRLLACRQITKEEREVRIDRKAAGTELIRRCPECFDLLAKSIS